MSALTAKEWRPRPGATSFTCADCGKETALRREGGTGYSIITTGPVAGEPICYACCAVRDTEHMAAGKPICLYLTHDLDGYNVSNWPGTLRIERVRVRTSWHNMAGKDGRRDVWFSYAGRDWHGVNVGDQQCFTVRAKVVRT